MAEQDKIKKLKKLIEKAELASIKASLAIQDVEKEIVFKGFKETIENGSVPNLSMATGGELILVFEGEEMCPEDIIKLMKNKGCIEPSDF